MANIRFCWFNHYTDGETLLTASSAVSAMPVAMSQDTDRSNVWRSSTGTGAQTIDIDLGSIISINAVCVANARRLGTQGALELYHRGDAAAPGAAVLVATIPAASPWTQASAAFFGLVDHRHWQLRFTNPFAESDYAELGFAFLGFYVEPSINVRVPMPMGRQDPSAMSASIDGQKTYATRTKFHHGAYVFDAVPLAQLEQLLVMFEEIGVATPIFVVLDSDITWTTWLVRIGSLTWVVEPGLALERYEPQLPWEEVR